MAELEEDPHKDVQGVLLSDEIEFYAKSVNLVDPSFPWIYARYLEILD